MVHLHRRRSAKELGSLVAYETRGTPPPLYKLRQCPKLIRSLRLL